MRIRPGSSRALRDMLLRLLSQDLSCPLILKWLEMLFNIGRFGFEENYKVPSVRLVMHPRAILCS